MKTKEQEKNLKKFARESLEKILDDLLFEISLELEDLNLTQEKNTNKLEQLDSTYKEKESFFKKGYGEEFPELQEKYKYEFLPQINFYSNNKLK